MKMLVIADFHISHKHKFPNPELRLDRDIKALWKLRDFVIKNNYDYLVFAGDTFDTNEPSIKCLNSVLHVFKSIEMEGKPKIILIRGNGKHEASVGWNSPLSTLQMACEPMEDKVIVARGSIPYVRWAESYNVLEHCPASVLFISHQENPEDWFKIIKEYRESAFQVYNKDDIIYIICHQWFDCFVNFDDKEVIKVEQLKEFLSKYPNKFEIISGHLHTDIRYQPDRSEQFEIWSVGIPLQQGFDDCHVQPYGIEIDTESKFPINQVPLFLVESEFQKVDPYKDIFLGVDIKNKCREVRYEYRDLVLDKQRFYQIDITDETSENIYKTMVKEGYYVKDNRIPSSNIPTKWEREKYIKGYEPRDIVETTVRELGQGDEKFIEELIQKGNEMIGNKVPF